VKLVELPVHITLVPLISQAGCELIVSVLVQVLMQPVGLVTTTVYVPAMVRVLMVTPVAGVNPAGPVQA
jgi:hypothetical protein